jgi:hypothetical protein
VENLRVLGKAMKAALVGGERFSGMREYKPHLALVMDCWDEPEP